MKTPQRSLASLLVLLIVALCALGSIEYNYVTSETSESEPGQYRTDYFEEDDPTGVHQSIEGPWNEIGQPHGEEITITVGGFRIVGTFENGRRNGEFLYYSEEGFTGRSETYAHGRLVATEPDPADDPAERSSSFLVLKRDMPWFLFHLEALGVSEEQTDALLRVLEEEVAAMGPRSRGQFAFALQNAIENAMGDHEETVRFLRVLASVEAQIHLKAFPMRRAFVDFYRDGGDSVYQVLRGSYPGFLVKTRSSGVSDQQLKAFIDEIEPLVADAGAIDPLSPLFLEQLDIAIRTVTIDPTSTNYPEVALGISALMGSMGREVDPLFLALYETVPFTGPLVLVGDSVERLRKLTPLQVDSAKRLLLVSRRAKRVQAFASVSNNGNREEPLMLRGTGGNRLFNVVYSSASKNVTSAMRLGRYRTPAIGENSAPVWVRATVSPEKSRLRTQKKGSVEFLQRTLNLSIRARSTTVPSVESRAGIRVRTRR